MQGKQEDVVNRFLFDRTNLLELFLTAIVVGTGINLSTSSITQTDFIHNQKAITFFVVGIISIVSSIIYFFLKLYGNKTKSKHIDGILFVSYKNKELIDCDGYRLSEDLHRFVRGLTSEDPVSKRIFEDFFNNNNKQKGFELINEAIEYFLIERLSTHLTDFYNSRRFDKNHIKELDRNDIPDILLSNRFLELFSKPMDKRQAFYEDSSNGTKSPGTIVMSYGKGSEIYSRFDLVLPKNSKVTRTSKNAISIDTGRIVLNFKIACHGSGAVPPRGYMELFTGHGHYNEYRCYSIDIDIDINFKVGALITRKGWEYYEWIDTFLHSIEKKADSDLYFKTINWESNYALLKVLLKRLHDEKKTGS